MKLEHPQSLDIKYVTDNEDGDKVNVIFFLIMTRQCNFRCHFCGLHFSDENLSYEVIDTFLSYLKKIRPKIHELRLEFFGGEPLLEFEKIKYIVEALQDDSLTGYSIVTNGHNLTEEMVEFFQTHNFEITFSVALHSKYILEREMFQTINKRNFCISFIIEPNKEKYMYEIYKKLLVLGFRKIDLIFIQSTQSRSDENLKDLEELVRKILLLFHGLLKKGIHISSYQDEEGSSERNDFQIIVECDGRLYNDIDTELFVLKDFVSREVFDRENLFLGSLKDIDLNWDDVVSKGKTLNPPFLKHTILEHLRLVEVDSTLGKIKQKYNLK